jgi:hypothetical protein
VIFANFVPLAVLLKWSIRTISPKKIPWTEGQRGNFYRPVRKINRRNGIEPPLEMQSDHWQQHPQPDPRLFPNRGRVKGLTRLLTQDAKASWRRYTSLEFGPPIRKRGLESNPRQTSPLLAHNASRYKPPTEIPSSTLGRCLSPNS